MPYGMLSSPYSIVHSGIDIEIDHPSTNIRSISEVEICFDLYQIK